VRASLVEEPEAKDALLKKLIGDHEPPYAQQWRDLGTEYQHRMMAGIVGFRLDVLEWACKLKLNQHRPEAHAAMRAGYAAGSEQERELGAWMARLGMEGK
jgi:transcriptional regulator